MNSPQFLALKAKMRHEGFIEVRLQGRCMEPFLMGGDTARIFPSKEVEVGDVCLVELKNTKIALHRVIAIKEDHILTKGDYSGLAEMRQLEHILGLARAYKFRGTDTWVDYIPGKISKSFSALLSRGIACNDEAFLLFVMKKGFRKLKWIEGSCLRKRCLKII